MRLWAKQLLVLVVALSALTIPVSVAHAQLTEHCTISILNRTARVRPDGSWRIDNVPANFGRVRARATCVEDGVTRMGQSDFFTLRENTIAGFNADISLAAVDPVPASLGLTAPTTTLTTAGATTQVTVTATLPGGGTRDVTAASVGTSYTTSNRAVATVSPDGLVTAVASGSAIVSALNEGALGLLRIQVVLTGGDSDGDGIPDDVELANRLNPNDPADAVQDADSDGLTNKQELIDFGTDFRVADTDGDGVRDGLEVQTGSNPLDPRSVNLTQALTSITVTPANFVLIVNTIVGEASLQLSVTGHLRDGSTLDLTATATGTTYTSSDLTICNLSTPAGRIFAGSDGPCTVTATNSGFSTQASGTVTTFAPIALSSIPIPGYANNVDVSGNFAYVAAGSAGLQVIDVTDPRTPRIVGAVDTPGNANDVRIVGHLAYLADGTAGLQIIDISTPTAPVLVGAVDTPGEAQDVAVSGAQAYVADGEAGLQVIDVSSPTAPRILGSVDTPEIARGIDVSGTVAVVADEGLPSAPTLRGTVQVVDVSDPSSPRIVGSVDLGLLSGNTNLAAEVKDVVVRNTLAYVAGFRASGLHIIDFSVPTNPRGIGTVPSSSGFAPRDLELSGQFVLATDVFSQSTVAIADVGNPASPVFRTLLDFSAFGVSFGTGIARSSQFVYMTAEADVLSVENGSTGDTRLLIGQYLDFPDDAAGIPPTVQITSPAPGDTVVEGATIPLTVNATDDVAVVSVDLLINGQVVSTGGSTFTFTVPSGATNLTLGATATDPGGNTGVAADVVVNVVPDRVPPTVRITSVVPGTTVMEGDTLTYYVTATDDVAVASVDFLVNGQVVDTVVGAYEFYYESFTVPVRVTSLTLGARATDVNGNIRTAEDVLVTVMPDPPPTVTITAPAPGTAVIEGDFLSISVTATDNTAGLSVDFLINGQVARTDTDAPYRFNLKVPGGISTLTLGATATDSVGHTNAATDVVITVTPDPGTAAIGRVIDRAGNPVAGATITCLGASGLSSGDGTYSVSGLSTTRGAILCTATFVTGDGKTLRGSSQSALPTPGGTTDVGGIIMAVSDPPLYPGQKFSVGNRPFSIVTADLNADGIPDLAVANRDSNDVSVLLSNGDGTFQLQRRFTVGSDPLSVTVGDLNGDGASDLVTANRNSNNVSVLLGQGDGTFQPQFNLATNSQPHSVAVGDLNRDGALDLVIANRHSNNLSVLLGSGNGTFQPQLILATSLSPQSVAVGDLNRDGLPDLVVDKGAAARASVFLGNGNGTFQTERQLTVGSDPQAVAVADLNGDGILDITTANFINTVSVLLGNGDGTFQVAQDFPVGPSPRAVAVTDLNADGILDIAVADNGATSKVSLLLGNGDGTFQPQQRYGGADRSVAIAVADLNADGAPDLVTANASSNDVLVLLAKGNGTLWARQDVGITGGSPEFVTTADLNADRIADLTVTGSFSTAVQVLLGNGDGSFRSPQRLDAGCSIRSATVGDFDANGVPDVAASSACGGSPVYVFLGNGNGTFQPPQITPGEGDHPPFLEATDVDGDEFPDLILRYSFSVFAGVDYLSLLRGNGNGTFQPAQRLTASGDFRSLVMLDLNADGALDLATTNFSSDQVSVLLGYGDGSFRPLQAFATGDGPGRIAAADVNADGNPDLITANEVSGDVSVLLGNGDGTFRAQQRFAGAQCPTAVAATDLNADGSLDLALTDECADSVLLLLGNGTGTFQRQPYVGTANGPRSLAVADVNGDGALDIAVANYTATSISLLLRR